MQDYNSLGKCFLDEDMNEINFKEKLEGMLNEIRSRKEKTTSIVEEKNLWK